jgi:putative restriction endonuclease
VSPSTADRDIQVRLAAFSWLAEQTDIHGDVLDRALLTKGFEYQGQRVALMSPQGIFRPRQLDLPLTITTAPRGPYDDRLDSGKFLHYRYRGTDPQHPDNVGLRKLMEQSRPLIYFFGLVPSRYLAVWPVYIVGDRPEDLTFEVAVEDIEAAKLVVDDQLAIAEGAEPRRVYVTSLVRTRLHQRSFRERVIEAYQSTCALCRLRHRELLDAAHIIPDAEDGGEPLVTNGLALCKLHHAAFDSFILGVSPDYAIQVREDVLEEADGPMLQYGLQGLHDQRIILPHAKADWPNRDALAWKYERFEMRDR